MTPDISLLRVFHAVMEECNVTAVAQRLLHSPSTTSAALGDELFLRAPWRRTTAQGRACEGKGRSGNQPHTCLKPLHELAIGIRGCRTRGRASLRMRSWKIEECDELLRQFLVAGGSDTG